MLVRQLHMVARYRGVPCQAACPDTEGGSLMGPYVHAGLRPRVLLAGCLSRGLAGQGWGVLAGQGWGLLAASDGYRAGCVTLTGWRPGAGGVS